MKLLNKRRIMESMNRLGGAMAAVGHDLANAQRDAHADENEELMDFYGRWSAEWAYCFLEMMAIPAEIPLVVYNMDGWAEAYRGIHAEGWDDAKKARFDFLLAHYQNLVEQATGGVPVELAESLGRGLPDYFIKFEDAEHDGDD